MSQRFKTLQEWLQWQETLHPVEIDLGLDRVQNVLHKLFPECCSNSNQFVNPYTVVTIAGTNGKGSTVAILAAILSEAGYCVGSYTSPHIVQYNERIKINQKPVSDQQICDAFERIELNRHNTSLTYFEFGTLAAIDVFYQSQCDIVILEVGLGGRLDAVNVLDPDIALITTVSIDHQEWLGSDINSIALEKAGIYRQDKPALYGDVDIPESLRQKVKQEQLEFYQFSKDYGYESYGETIPTQWNWLPNKRYEQLNARFALPQLQLQGKYQLKNACNALMTLELLKEKYPVTQAEIKRGLMSVQLNGRFQIVATEPMVVLDVAHNAQAVEQMKQTFEHLSVPGKLHVIVGRMKDKDIKNALATLVPIVQQWRVVDLNTPRAIASQELEQILLSQNIPHESISRFNNVGDAYKDFIQAASQNEKSDILLIFGSFFTVSEALTQIAC